MVKGEYFSDGFDVLETKQNKKKVEFFQRRGWCRVTIFWLLFIFPETTDATNGEMCILFKGVWCTWNKNKKRKQMEFFQRYGVVVMWPFSDF